MATFTMTDKAETKTLPCMYPGCAHEVIVNKFFTPAKARCPEHSGQPAASLRAMVIDPSKQAGEVVPVVPNHNLMGLCCPICDQPMTIRKISDMGWPTFVCPAPCGTAVEIQVKWAPLLMPGIPSGLKDAIKEFNGEQVAKQGHAPAVAAPETVVEKCPLCGGKNERGGHVPVQGDSPCANETAAQPRDLTDRNPRLTKQEQEEMDRYRNSPAGKAAAKRVADKKLAAETGGPVYQPKGESTDGPQSLKDMFKLPKRKRSRK